jgi:glycosyltransferase involved in cell wall biosynthesis
MAIFFNSIISTHRDRIGSLRGFLCSIKLASKYVNKDSFEVVITDLGQDDSIETIINAYRNFFNIKLLRPRYKGTFWKSKALNHCVLNSDGNYVTMIDIDAIVQPNFLESVESFFSNPSNYDTKLAHRVQYLDAKQSKFVTNNNFDEAYVIQVLRNNHKKYLRSYERYTSKEVKIRDPKNNQRKWLANKALGCSHFTMRKEDYLAIGGYDESFIGWACEDLDFNRRAFVYLGKGTLRPEPQFIVFSVSHQRKSWMNDKNTKRNKRLYESNKKAGVIKIPITKSWGQF